MPSIERVAMARWSLGFAAAAVVAALFWFLVVAAESSWVGRALAFALLALTVLAFVLGPGRRSAADVPAPRP
jgi:hypothetical protein